MENTTLILQLRKTKFHKNILFSYYLTLHRENGTDFLKYSRFFYVQVFIFTQIK